MWHRVYLYKVVECFVLFVIDHRPTFRFDHKSVPYKKHAINVAAVYLQNSFNRFTVFRYVEVVVYWSNQTNCVLGNFNVSQFVFFFDQLFVSTREQKEYWKYWNYLFQSRSILGFHSLGTTFVFPKVRTYKVIFQRNIVLFISSDLYHFCEVLIKGIYLS